MAADSRYKMSQEKFEQFKKELEILENDRAREVSEQIKVARSFGDLSENSEYDEAKNEQAKLYSKIAEIKDLVEHAEIIKDEAAAVNPGAVRLNSRVVIREVGETEEENYKIVGSSESDPRLGFISDESPLGRSLMGHVQGNVIDFEAPMGVLRYEILSVEN